MTDIAHVWNNDIDELHGDWLIDGPDLADNADLRTAVIISLFSDHLASPDDVLPDLTSRDRRGWWGDTGGPDSIGCKWWLRVREKWTEQIRVTLEDDAREALQWLIDDGVVDEVQLTTIRSEIGRIDMNVTLLRGGQSAFSGTYGWAWAQEYGS